MINLGVLRAVLSLRDEMSPQFLGAVSKMQRTGQQMRSIGAGLTVGVTLPIAAVGIAAVKMASDAEEAANKFNVVMGPAADRVRAELQKLTETIPLTRSQMEGMTAGIQDMLVPMGVARAEAANMSLQMVGLAGDLGSFNDVGTDQVLMAMQSALAGSSEPMRRFGVDTREAALKAIALQAGLLSAGQEMNQTARAQAVLLAIQKDSTDAMGDAARTAESMANLMKFLKRDVLQLGISLGQVLIPAVRPLLVHLREWVEWLKQLDPQTQKWIVLLGGVAAAAGPVLVVMGLLVTTVSGVTAGLSRLTMAMVANAAAAKANAAANAANNAVFIVSQSRLGSFVHLLPNFMTKTIQGRNAMGQLTAGVRVFNKEFLTAPWKISRFSGVLGKASLAAGKFSLALQGTGAAATAVSAGVFTALGVAIAGLAVGAHKLGEHMRATTSEFVKLQDIIRAVFARGDVSSRASDLAREIGVLDRHGVLAAGSMEKLRAKLKEMGVVMGRTADETVSSLSDALKKVDATKESAERLATAIERVTKANAPLITQLRSELKNAIEKGGTIPMELFQKTVDAFGGSSDMAQDVIGRLISEMAELGRASEQARGGVTELSAEVDQMLQSLEGRTLEGMAQQVRIVDDALGHLKGKLPIEELRRLRDEWEPWLSRLGVTAPELEKVIVQANKLREAGKKLRSVFLENTPIKAPELDLTELTNGMDEFSRASEKLPKHLLSLGAGLSNTQRAALGMPPVLETMSENTEAFGKSLQGTSVLLLSFESNLGKAFAGAASGIQGFQSLFGGGRGLGGFVKDFKRDGELSFGSFFEGFAKNIPAIGQLVGPAIALLGMLFKPKWKKIAKEGARLFGKEFSEKLSKELLKSQKALGSFKNAVAANIGDIAQEVGVNAKNLGQTMQSLSVLIGMVENGTVKWAEAAGQLDKAFDPVKDQLVAMGTEGLFQLGRLIERMRELGKVSADVQAFIQEKASSAVEAMTGYFENLAKQEDLTAERAQELVGVVATAFQAAIAAGGGLLGAVQQLGPAFGEVIQKLRGVLGDDNPLLNQVSRFYNFVSNNQEQLSAISSLGTAFKELASIGLINAANIGDFAGTFRAEFDKILASTQNQTAALAAMGPQVGLLLESYRELGMQVPPWLEEMAGKAKEAGANLTPPEDAIDVFRDIRDMLGELVDALKGVGDEARRAGGALAGMGRGGVPQPHFDDDFIPGFQRGGFVPETYPHGRIVRVAEPGTGGELITPRRGGRVPGGEGGGAGGGGVTIQRQEIVIDLRGTMTLGNGREIAEALAPHIREAIEKNAGGVEETIIKVRE